MRYKVLLADDEEEILQSIRRKIRWETYGFEVVGTFLNGRDVLEFLAVKEADIVITDIRMPFMDGIELAKNIYERYPHIKVIIISGYGDFNYAKEAMRYRVSEYILKPVNVKEIEETLQKTRETLDREVEERKNIHLLEKEYLENLPVIRENLLNRMIAGDVENNSLKEQLRNCGITIADASCWVVALIRVEKRSGHEMDEPYVPIYIRNLLQERFSGVCRYSVFYNRRGECVIFGMKEQEQFEKILIRLNGIVRESKRTMGFSPVIGVGKIKNDLMDLKGSFEEAEEALLYRELAGENDVICMKDIDVSERKTVLFDEKDREMLFLAVKFGNSDGIRLTLQKIYEKIKDLNIGRSDWQAWSVSVMNALLLLIQQHQDMGEEVFADGLDCLKILAQYKDIDSFFGWLEEKCLSIGRYFEKKRTHKMRNTIGLAQEHIRKGFGNAEMSLENVAAKIGLTPTYFSSLFKKETGESFVEYLTRLRMEEAMRMLEETDEMIYVIAEKTGYPDAAYFSYVFKKKYGISPIQYRRKKNKM